MSAQSTRDKAAKRPNDVIAAVLEDHAEIEELFAKVEAAKSPGAKENAFRRLTRKLVEHEAAEQEVVHPLARAVGNGRDEQSVKARLNEEARGEQRLRELEKLDAGDPAFDRKLAQLKKDVLTHAQNEERKEHPIIEEHTDGDELRDRAKVFRLAEKAAPTHPHPNGPLSAIGNIVVGPVVAVLDRLRDVIKAALNV